MLADDPAAYARVLEAALAATEADCTALRASLDRAFEQRDVALSQMRAALIEAAVAREETAALRRAAED